MLNRKGACLVVVALGVVGCRANTSPARLQQSDQAPPAAQVAELMTEATSAYVAGLAVVDDAIYVLTNEVVHRWTPQGRQRIPVENGITAAVTRTEIVYWAKGAIWAVPHTGGAAQRLATLAHPPQSFIAAGDRFAWLDMPARDQFAIQTLEPSQGNGAVRTLFFHPGRIETVAMDPEHVFFVARDDTASWRIGNVALRGGDVRFGPRKKGATPARLAVAGDVFYYDLDSGELRQLGRDLSTEQVLAKDLICSPLAVGAKVVLCPNMDGLFALDRHPGAAPVALFPERRRIAAIAVGSRSVAWLADAGADRLSLMMLPLGE